MALLAQQLPRRFNSKWMTCLHCLRYSQFQRRRLFRLLRTLRCPSPPSHLQIT
uniref:Mitochondrial transcription termination factor 3 n=1 Tax=Mus musculus TaxID=10090 RepID=G3UWX0_MOUSE